MTLPIYLTLKGHSPICLMFLIIIIMVDHYLLCGYYDPNGMKQPLRTQLIEWHKATKMTCLILPKRFMSTVKQTFSCSSQVAFKFRNAFFTDTGIDPFQSCTIAGVCMNVLRTSHLIPNSIGRVPVNGYRSLRNYSDKSMEWITYCEKKALAFSYRQHLVCWR